MKPSRKKIWLTLIPAMCLPFLASLFYFVLFSEYTFSRAIYVGTKVFTLVWPALAVWLIYRAQMPRPAIRDSGRLKAFLLQLLSKLKLFLAKVGLARRNPNHLKAIPLGLIAGLTIVLTLMGLMLTPLALVVVDGGAAIGRKTTELGVLNHFWIFAVFISVFHSALEEYYWRWFVYGQLREVTGRWTAHLLAGVTFAAHHIVITTQFFPFWWGVFFGSMVGFGGVIFSLLYERQKSLVGAWIAHMLIDFGIMAIGYELIT